MVAETLQAGAVVAEVARRWQVCPQQVFTWRREMRSCVSGSPDFVPIVTEPPVAVPERPAPAPVEVHLAGAVLRVSPGTHTELLMTVLRALRAFAT